MDANAAAQDSGGEGAPEEMSPEERLDALGKSLETKRSEAVAARQASGIEEQWAEDEEFYQGIDDANRNEHGNAWRTKPPGQYQAQVQNTTRSTVFPNITRPYVDAAAARIADMLLPTDDRSWGIKPTPIPDLVEIAKGNVPPEMQQQAAASGGNPAQLQQQAQALIDEAQKKADKAQTRIEDWHVECQWHSEVRKVIEDAARIGTGVMKGPVPVKRKVVALTSDQPEQGVMQKLIGGVRSLFNSAKDAAQTLVVKEELKPASKRIDPWNLYPDGSCGENIHNGSYVWERDHLTERQLKDLRTMPGYLTTQIESCIEEGPVKDAEGGKREPEKHGHEDKRYEVWYFHGTLDKDDLLAAGCNCKDIEQKSISALVTMVNERVIKAAMNPLDSGDFPYDVMPWQRKSGMPWGSGVGRQGRTAQRIVTAGWRNRLDNGGLAAGGMIVIKPGMVTPADGAWSIGPRKIWYAGEDSETDDVKKAFSFVEIPSVDKELREIILDGQKLMEDATGLPMLLQGQQGKAPETVGGMTLLNNNASAVLRRLARLFDDCITEPHVRRYYTWLLQHGDDNEKGDFTIDARGSTALVERDMQNQQIPQLLQASNNPVFGIDPKKAMDQYLRSLHLDPKNFEFDDADWKKIVENMKKGPQDPRLQVAQLKEQGESQRLQQEQQFESQQKAQDRQLQLVVEQTLERIQAMKLQGAKEISFEELKAMLAETAMKLNTQRSLSAADLATTSHQHAVDTAVDLHKHHNPPPVITPPTEPAGKAAPGKAFQA